jgi:hypothetical protein
MLIKDNHYVNIDRLLALDNTWSEVLYQVTNP